MVKNQQCVICWLDQSVTVLAVFPELGWRPRRIVLHVFVSLGGSETTPTTERSNVSDGHTSPQVDINYIKL